MGTVRSFWTLSSATFVSLTGNQVLEALSGLLGHRCDKLSFFDGKFNSPSLRLTTLFRTNLL